MRVFAHRRIRANRATRLTTGVKTPTTGSMMKPALLAAACAVTIIASPAFAQSSSSKPYASLIESHAASNGVPVELVHRIIVRESRYNAGAMGRGGAIGLMQIKLATARGLGYTGTAAGLRDPETNLTYGVRYLAGAYRAANGQHGRAVGYYASGYYYAAKRQRMQSANAYANAADSATSMEPLSLDPTASRRKTRHR
jgi:soluble lytic murein transglycosylase-like protein